jgi:hypothetical protein
LFKEKKWVKIVGNQDNERTWNFKEFLKVRGQMKSNWQNKSQTSSSKVIENIEVGG